MIIYEGLSISSQKRQYTAVLKKKKKSSYSGLFTAQKWSLFITYADRPYMASILYLHGKPGATSGS